MNGAWCDNIGLESSSEQRLSDQASTYDPRFQIPRGRSAYEVWNYNDVSMNKLTTKRADIWISLRTEKQWTYLILIDCFTSAHGNHHCEIADLDSEIVNLEKMLTGMVNLKQIIWLPARRRREKIGICGLRLRISNGEITICDEYCIYSVTA